MCFWAPRPGPRSDAIEEHECRRHEVVAALVRLGAQEFLQVAILVLVEELKEADDGRMTSTLAENLVDSSRSRSKTEVKEDRISAVRWVDPPASIRRRWTGWRGQFFRRSFRLDENIILCLILCIFIWSSELSQYCCQLLVKIRIWPTQIILMIKITNRNVSRWRRIGVRSGPSLNLAFIIRILLISEECHAAHPLPLTLLTRRPVCTVASYSGPARNLRYLGSKSTLYSYKKMLEKNRVIYAGNLCQTFKNFQFSISYGRIEMIRKDF